MIVYFPLLIYSQLKTVQRLYIYYFILSTSLILLILNVMPVTLFKQINRGNNSDGILFVTYVFVTCTAPSQFLMCLNITIFRWATPRSCNFVYNPFILPRKYGLKGLLSIYNIYSIHFTFYIFYSILFINITCCYRCVHPSHQCQYMKCSDICILCFFQSIFFREYANTMTAHPATGFICCLSHF